MSTTIENSDHTAEISNDQPSGRNSCSFSMGERLQQGMVCPRCKKAKIEYNGMLNLVCPNCGLTETGAFT